jgi:o-succinylbenzoate---CoA ligase
MPPAEAARKPGSAGKPLLFTSVKIVDDAGRELPRGQPGEIVVSGPTVMAGYFNAERGMWSAEPAADPFRTPHSPFRTLNTGDIGYLDADGDLWLVQRRSDLIVTGGENVYPAEVEAALREHPAVEEICVVGVPDPQWGQRVAAMAAVGGDVTAADLLRFARQRLAGYKIPRQIHLVNALPLTASGKIAREQVARLLAGEPAGDDAAA